LDLQEARDAVRARLQPPRAYGACAAGGDPFALRGGALVLGEALACGTPVRPPCASGRSSVRESAAWRRLSRTA
jgi:hypothetical protein